VHQNSIHHQQIHHQSDDVAGVDRSLPIDQAPASQARDNQSAPYLLAEFDHHGISVECRHIGATDAHDLPLRPPVLSEARARIVVLAGAATAEALVMHNPAAVVAGRSIAI
jgi:hypothetical protein